MAKKIVKKLVVDKTGLKDWMVKNKLDYKALSEKTGLSVTQCFNLTRRSTGGAVTLGYLLPLKIPIFLVTYEIDGVKKKVLDAQRVRYELCG